MRNYEPLYTVKEAATLLGVSERTIYRWIEEEKIKAVKLGFASVQSRMMIPQSAITQFLQENTTTTTIEKLTGKKDFLKEFIKKLDTAKDIKQIKERLQLILQTIETA